MRQVILLTVIIFIFIGKANSQFLEIGNKWIYEYRDYSVLNGTYTEKFDSIEIVSDTIINGLHYYKLVVSEDDPCGTFTNIEYLRENNEKIYRLLGDKTDENLMIDFGASNSYDMTYEAAGHYILIETLVIIDSISTEVLPSGEAIELTYQRIINNSSYGDETTYKLSKKIGYIQNGLLFPNIGTGLCDVYLGIYLRCYISENDTIHLTALDCFESSISSSNKNFKVEEINLSPNPSIGIILLPEQFESVKIYDNIGRQYNAEIEGNILDISSFPKGLYFINLFKKEKRKIYLSKIIKL